MLNAGLWITLLFVLGFSSAEAANPALTTARKEITVRQLAPIEFGIVVGSATGGTVTIAASTGMRTVSPSLAELGGQYGQAEFEISGQPGEEVTVIVPESVRMDSQKGHGGLTMEKLSADPSGVVTLGSDGRARVKIGGVLRVPAGVSQGSFQGYFDIDARYLR